MSRLTVMWISILLLLIVIGVFITASPQQKQVYTQPKPTVYSVRILDSTTVLLLSYKDTVVIELANADRLSEEELIVLIKQ